MAKTELHDVFEELVLVDVLLKPDGTVQTKHARTITGPNFNFHELYPQTYNPGDIVPDEIVNFLRGFAITTGPENRDSKGTT